MTLKQSQESLHELGVPRELPPLPNAIIMRIIREGNGGRHGYTHKNQFNRCVDELGRLNKSVIEELDIWFGEEDDWIVDGQATDETMFHYDGHEDDFKEWAQCPHWSVENLFPGDKIDSNQGFSITLMRLIISDRQRIAHAPSSCKPLF